MDKVVFKNVYMKYDGAGDYSLSDISFSAREGETVGIIGGTGSGKTTLVSMIPGFYKAMHGEILISGKNIKDYDEKELKSKVGFCFQKYYLFHGNIRDNIKFGAPDATDEDIIEALKISQGYDFVMQKKNGLLESVSEKGANFSGGQKQRLMIARAIVRKPEILILDDSSSALDFATDKKLRMAISELKKITTFIVSQRVSSIIHSDKILVLDDGKLVGVGTHSELLNNNLIYREIYESQTKDK